VSEALTALRERIRHDVEIEGDVYTIELPSLRRSIMRGGLPLPVLEKFERNVEAQTANGDSPQFKALEGFQPDEVKALGEFNEGIVRESVKAVNGVELDEDDDIVAVLPDATFDLLLAYAMRVTPIPKAEA